MKPRFDRKIARGFTVGAQVQEAELTRETIG